MPIAVGPTEMAAMADRRPITATEADHHPQADIEVIHDADNMEGLIT